MRHHRFPTGLGDDRLAGGMLWLMPVSTLGRVKQAWASLATVEELARLQVVVRPNSPLCPPGWIGLLVLGDTVTAAVPSSDLRAPLEAALRSMETDQVTTPDIVLPRLPPIRDVLGPASLFYPVSPCRAPPAEEVEEASIAELAGLLGAVAQEELDESGLAHVAGTAFVWRASDRRVLAACGHRRWPNGVAHLSVLAHPQHRRLGYAQAVATAAINRALDEGLLPQWRARPAASKALATKLGLVELGAQLSLRPA